MEKNKRDMTITVATRVASVVVYPDRARISATGELSLTKGNFKLAVDDLPLSMQPDSIRVSGRGEAKVQIANVDVFRTFFEDAPSDRVRELEEMIDQAKDELKVILDQESVLNAQKEYMDGLRKATKQFAKGLAGGKSTVEDQSRLTSFIQKQDEHYRAEIRELDKEQRAFKRKIGKLEKDLAHIHSARPKERYTGHVGIEVAEPGKFMLEVQYLVANAGWKPLYDVRFSQDDNGPALSISYLAEIVQNTGEDWENVSLSVSTARPALNQQLPKLDPWYIDVHTPRPAAPEPRRSAPQLESRPLGQGVLSDMAPASVVERPAQLAEVLVAQAEDLGVAVTYKVAGGSDVPGDGSGHKTTIQRYQIQPEIDYLAVPKHTDAVFRRATATYPGPGPLLEGKANLFVEEAFIGSSELEYTPAGGEVELLLGVEERIIIEREIVRREVDKRRLRDRRVIQYEYEIKVENLLPNAFDIELRDHIPVSRHEDVSVKLEKETPAADESSDLNILEWHLELQPGEVRTINFAFQVEHPRGLRIIGLID